MSQRTTIDVTCLHCGTQLPPVGDAFCPQCGGDLDEAPRPRYEHFGTTASAAPGRNRRQRPLGLSLLAFLHFGGGAVLGVMLIVNYGKLMNPGQVAGVSPASVVIGTGFLSFLGMAAGIGIWMHRQWGWWLGAFYYVYSIARNASVLLLILGTVDEMQGGTRGPSYYIAKHAGRIAVHFLILLYFFKSNVLAYFGLEHLSKSKAISTLVGACATIGVVGSLVTWLAS